MGVVGVCVCVWEGGGGAGGVGGGGGGRVEAGMRESAWPSGKLVSIGW